jgi:hypothetical protein
MADKWLTAKEAKQNADEYNDWQDRKALADVMNKISIASTSGQRSICLNYEGLSLHKIKYIIENLQKLGYGVMTTQGKGKTYIQW